MPFIFVLAVVGYLVGTLALFLFGPIQWAVELTPAFYLYMTAIHLVVLTCLLLSVSTHKENLALVCDWHFKTRLLVLILFIAAITAIVQILIYTDPTTTDAELTFGEVQNEVYLNRLWKLETLSFVQRLPGIVITSIGEPILTFAIVVGFYQFPKLSWMGRICVLGVLGSIYLVSIYRGSDKQLFDAIFMAVVGLSMGVISRSHISMHQNRRKSGRGKLFLLALFLLVPVVLFLDIFFQRRLGRYGGEAIVCNANADSCLSDALLNSAYSDEALSIIYFATNYITQGYYGLALAFHTAWESTIGFGFTPMLLRLSTVFSDQSIVERSYHFKLGDNYEWFMDNSWSTFYAWAANDFGWPGSLLIVAALTFLLGRAFMASHDGNPFACVVLHHLLISVLFFPMNNQLFQAPGSTISFLIWLFVWMRSNSTDRNNFGLSGPALGN